MFLEFTWNAWEKRKLGEIFQIIDGDRGTMYPHESDFRSTGHTLFLDTGNVLKNRFSFETKKYISRSKDSQLRAGKLLINDIVLTSRGTLGNIALYDSKISKQFSSVRINSAMLILRQERVININSFLIAILSGGSLEKFIEKNHVGSAQPHLTKHDLSSLQLSMPIDAKEQTSIGRFFDNLTTLIAATQHKIDALEQIKEKLSQNLFDQSWRFKEYSTPWKENKLKDIVSAYSGGTPSANIRTYYGGHIPFIRSAEIHSSTTALTLTQEGLQNSSAKLVKTGDILYALYGANSGDVDRSKINGAINQAILAMRPSKENDPNFILFQLMRMKDKIVSTYLQGGQGNLSGRLILALNLDMPESTLEQRTIGRLLQLLCELIGVNQSKYSQLELLKKSLLQNLFV